LQEISAMTRHPNPIMNRLLTRKAAIENYIADELKRPLPDTLRLHSLKRARLSLKDRAARLMNSSGYDMTRASVRAR